MAIGLVPLQSDSQDNAMAAHSALLKDTIINTPHDFLRARSNLHDATLLAVKHYIDPLAVSTSTLQTTRLHEARRKRKRGQTSIDDSVLRLKQLYLDGFSTDQVWEQCKRILDAASRETRIVLDAAPLPVSSDAPAQKNVRFEEVDREAEISEDDDSELDSELENANGDEQLEDDSGLDEDIAVGDLDDGPAIEDASDIEADDDSAMLEEEDIDQEQPSSSVFTKDKHGLNDGFFSIDEFNKNTGFLEQVDARGENNDGAASDEEDIDWTTDPMNQPLPDAAQGPRTASKAQSTEDGPIFGNADLDAPWTDDEDEQDDEDVKMDGMEQDNTNEIYYKDFFAPPPRTLTKTKRMRALPKTQPAEVDDEDLQRTISAVHRDIFSDDEIEGSDVSDGQAEKHLSTHEQRRKVLAEQIRKLEAEAVAKREWTLVGEARAIDRPVNSLLEDDVVLDFERIGKPVPEATAASTESIEELIKLRILARNFDEIPKRRAGLDTSTSTQGRRGLVELDDRKNPQSLVEIYEDEHLKATDPNYVDSRDVETKKAHQEIEALWKSVSVKLDALCSWHYKPKPADMEVRVISDAPRVQMEDARPSGIGINTEESGLAPQEVYRVGEDLNGKRGNADVVVSTGGTLAARAELTREQKLRRRRREKERIKKKGSGTAAGVNSAQSAEATGDVVPGKRVRKTAEKRNILDDLRRGNVKVIGKGGAVQDVEGRGVQVGAGSTVKAGMLKL